jgi:hypothetical protein
MFGFSYVFRCDINYPLEGRKMEYVIGVILTLAVAAFAAVIGFDRERAFYPTVLIVIASYYALFAVMGASTRTLIIETIVAGVFVLFAVLGFKGNYWLVVAALIGDGVFDFVRHFFIDNPGVPQWWPGFCLASDVVFGAWLAVRMIRQRQPSVRGSTA